MAVALTVTLPDAAARRIPLGGNGLSAPHSMYLLDTQLAGDASGGAASILTVMDERYCTMVRWIGMAISATNADTQYRIHFNSNSQGNSPRVGVTGTLVGVASTVSSEGAVGFWSPPQTIFPPGNSVTVSFTNVNGDTFRLTAEILLWDIRVRELTPWPYLMHASGGGGFQSVGI